MKKPLISVIVPIYNVELYLERCIISIITQTIHDIEIILIDDGSTDKSSVIADRYALKDDRILVVHKPNGGLSDTRNTGIKLAKGEYLSFIDSDDWIESTMLESMYEKACLYNADIVVCGVCTEFVNENRIAEYKSIDRLYVENDNIGELFWKLSKKNISNYMWNKIYKSSLLSNNSLCVENLVPMEDLFFNLKAFKCAKSIYVSSGLFYHYMRRDSFTLLSSYYSRLGCVYDKMINSWNMFFDYFNLKGRLYDEYILRLRSLRGLAITLNIYKQNSPYLNDKQNRLLIINKEIYGGEFSISNTIKSKSFIESIYLYSVRNFSPYMFDIVFMNLFRLRYSFRLLYYKIRSNLIK